MKIERVDDRTLKCFISNDELNEFEIDYKDFLMRSDRAKEVVKEIIEQAQLETGYVPPRASFDLQIMMVPDQGLVLTFSEKDEQVAPGVQEVVNCLAEMKKVLEKTREKMGIPDQSEKTPTKANNQESVNKNAKQNESEKALPDFVVFRFEHVGRIMDFANVLPKTLRVDSTLYKAVDGYYLVLRKGTASYERYSRTCVQALEFSGEFCANEDKELYLREHAECLIHEKALRRLNTK